MADDEKTLLAVDMSKDAIQSPLLKAKHHLLENVFPIYIPIKHCLDYLNNFFFILKLLLSTHF